MKIAYVTSQRRGETDRLLSEIAETLQAAGLRLAGIVKDLSYTSRHANGCDMRVRVLSEGSVIKITQDLGEGSGACRLDPAAIAEAISRVEADPMEGASLFILNKFGPEESAGRGFCPLIASALERGIPVLVGVGSASEAAFSNFSGGMAKSLPDNLEDIHHWCAAVM
ncbi:DUF2478 domain-containing protein [Leisingera sp. ANG-M7]|uniref:DUF2478 domain-containing protein n=1 Tax=Leisingera sp. ANG-M7 TaxID=1577902 RepID=UPI00057C634E|nr:DUF2478 domain-containing protein [Leisingera sp. ANG-M7]KIC35088.1 hypothetical protein RA26_19160 [Leisingera sp. ANG-M7]